MPDGTATTVVPLTNGLPEMPLLPLPEITLPAPPFVPNADGGRAAPPIVTLGTCTVTPLPMLPGPAAVPAGVVPM